MTPTRLKLNLFAGISCLALAAALCGNDAPQGTSTQAQETKPTTRKSLREDPANPVALIKTNHGDVYVELFVKEAPKTVGNFLDLANGKKEFTVARPPTPSMDAPKPEKVKRPYYDGLIFHRVIKGFMIQGGCPLGTGSGGPGYKFEDEINATALGLDKLKAFTEPVKGEQDPKKRGGPHPWLLIRSRRDFEQRVLMPIVKKLGIKNQKEFEDRFKEVKATLLALTLKEAFENQGYRYDDKRGSHKPVRGSLAMANSGPNTNGSQFFINLVDTPHLTGKHTVFGKVIEGMDIVDKIGAVPVGMGAKPTKPVTILTIREVDYPAGPSGR